MALVTQQNSLGSSTEIINDILTINNKDLMLVSLLETLCKITDSKSKLFKKICRYLHKIGILEDPNTYSDDSQMIRKLYSDYLESIMKQHCSTNTRSKKQKLIQLGNTENMSIMNLDTKPEYKLQVINSQYSKTFIEMEKIGDGGFGEVYKAYNYLDTTLYAIKKVPFFDVNDPNNIRAFNEVRCLALLNHENIVRYHTTWLELSDKKMDIMEDVDAITPIYPVLFIQMELCTTSLRKYLVERNYSGKESNMEWEKECIRGIINGLKYIHANNILHRDLNPNNIFLDRNMIPKIGDFGMAVKVDTENETTEMSEDIGVQVYMPPEYKFDGTYTKKSDVYSAGIIFFELLYIFSTDMERLDVINKIKKGIYPESFITHFEKSCGMIKGMLSENVDERSGSDNLFV